MHRHRKQMPGGGSFAGHRKKTEAGCRDAAENQTTHPPIYFQALRLRSSFGLSPPLANTISELHFGIGGAR